LDPRSETNAALTPVELASRLNRISFAGGRDNLPALVRAWDRAAASPRSAVLWIHGPQPVLLNTTDALRQRYERRPEGPPIHAFQTRGGPNRIMENLDALPAILPAVRLASVDQDLRKLLERLSTNRPEIRLERSAEPASELSEAPGRRKASFQLARLWARDEINRRMRHRMTQQALQLAGNYQLVTPWSGAVVLETLQQFAAAGLQPVDATTVPSVPEPSTITLGFIGGAVLLWALRRPRRRHKPCSAREGVTH
jgi:hypothetical protein